MQISRKGLPSLNHKEWMAWELGLQGLMPTKTWVQDVCFFELAAVDVFNLWKRNKEAQCYCQLECKNLFCPNVYNFDVIVFAQKDATVGSLNFFMERWENQ